MNQENFLHVYVTSHDVKAYENKLCTDPIEHALQRQTGSKWLIFEQGYVRETVTPFRTGFLPEVIRSLREWIHINGSARAFDFDLEVHHVAGKTPIIGVFKIDNDEFDADFFKLAQPFLEGNA